MSREKGYSIKYALTEGIIPVTVETGLGSGYGNGRFVYTVGQHRVQLIRNNTFWETKEAAEKYAKQLAERKIASLKKALAKMEVLAKTPKWK